MNNKRTVTLEEFCEGAKQLLALEASLNGEAVSTEWAKKIALWEMGLFRIVIMGEIKKGKSSFINALLGEEGLVPICTDVATSTIYKICYGPQLEYRVFFTKESQKNVLTIGKDEVEQYGTETGNPNNEKGVDFIQVLHPSPLLKSGMVILDTPGLGGVIKNHKEITYSCVPKADAVFIVTESDGAPLGVLEKSLIEDIKQVTSHIYFVQTKSNQAKENSVIMRARNLDILENECGFDKKEIKYFVVDSKQKLRADRKQDKQLLDESGFIPVANFLNQYIRPNVQRLIISKALSEIKPKVDFVANVLQDREQVYSNLTAEKKEQLKNEIEAAQFQLEQWEYEILPNLEHEFENNLLMLQEKVRTLLDTYSPQSELYNELVSAIGNVSDLSTLSEVLNQIRNGLCERFSEVSEEAQKTVIAGITTLLDNFCQQCSQNNNTLTVRNDINTVAYYTPIMSPTTDLCRFEMKGFEVVRNGFYGGSAGGAIGGVIGGTIGSIIPVVGTAVGATIGSCIGSIWGGSSSVKIAEQQNLNAAKNAAVASISSWMGANHRNLTNELTMLFSKVKLHSSSALKNVIRTMRKQMKDDLAILEKDAKTQIIDIECKKNDFQKQKSNFKKAVAMLGGDVNI